MSKLYVSIYVSVCFTSQACLQSEVKILFSIFSHID